jgi:hypothetical protein
MIQNARPSPRELRRGEAATWGRKSSTPTPHGRAAADAAGFVKPITKGALRGFTTVELSIGLELIDCPVLTGPNGPWAALPSGPQIDKDGRQKTDLNGKRAFEPALEWRDRTLGDRFSAAVVALVRAAHPNVLDKVRQ